MKTFVSPFNALIRSRYTFALLLFFVSGLATMAQPRSETAAAALAAQFLQVQKGGTACPQMRLVARQRVSQQIRRTIERPLEGFALQPGFYVFNEEAGHGFVIVGADARQEDILAYALEGSFDADDIPCGMALLLEQYNHEFQSVQSQVASLHAPRRIQTTPVTPIIKAKWGQNEPFNNYCPMDPATNKRCVTGCVATAMAQVMYHYRYPSSPADSVVNYVSQQNEQKIGITKRLSSLALKWSEMIPVYESGNYTTSQGNAVASLMYAAGLSVHMSYGSKESSSFCSDEAYALINFFGYNPNLKYLKKNYYPDATWMELIQKELSAGRPILYGGFGPEDNEGKRAGHAFILDGIDGSGRCHFNWGWSGNYQTSGSSYIYFSLTSLKPGSHNYTYNQEMVIGISTQKMGSHEMVFYAEEFDIEGWQQGFNVGDVAVFSCPAHCYDAYSNTFHTPIPCYLTFGMKNANNLDGKLTLLNDLIDEDYRLFRNGWGPNSFKRKVTFDAARFKEGESYYLYPAVLNAQASTWYNIHTRGGQSDYYVARVKNGKIYLGQGAVPSLPNEGPNISFVSQTSSNSNLSKMKAGDRIYLNVVFKNAGSTVTTDTRVRIFNAGLQGISYTAGVSHEFKGGGTQTSVDMTCTLPEMADGDYYATIQYYRSWTDEQTWIYNKTFLVPFTVANGSGSSTEMSVATSAAGYATFYDSSTSYLLPSGLTAYVVSAASGGSLTYTSIASGSQSGVIPKGVAVMLKGTGSTTYKLQSTNASASYTGANLLRGSDVSTTTSASGSGYLFYKLSYGHSGSAYSDVFGWYWGAANGGAFTIPGHKAWLALKESTTRADFFSLDGSDGATGIEDLDNGQWMMEDAEIYNLGGQRLSKPRRGVNIINGKKVLVK